MGVKTKHNFLKRDLGLVDIFCIASGAMISSGLFILPGLAFAKAGPAVILSYGIASLLVIPAVLSKAELATAMPKAGGTYFFIDRSLGPLIGTTGGFAAWFSLAFKSAFALIGIGIFTVLVSPVLTEFHTKLIAVIFCLTALGCAPLPGLNMPEPLPPIVREHKHITIRQKRAVNTGIYLNKGDFYSILGLLA